MGKKYTIGYIEENFNKEGYKLLTSEYNGCKQKLDFICPNGHRHNISFDKWLKGQRCYYCNGNVRLSNTEVKREFEENGYILLSQYKNSGTKLKYKCPQGHIGEMKWDHFRDGHRCPECSGNKPISREKISARFSSMGYKFLDKINNNGIRRLSYVCDKGHYGETTWYNFNKGIRCNECAGKAKKTVDFLRNEFNTEGYALVTENYENCHQKLHLVCPNGHNYYVSWDNWNNKNSRCTKCSEWGRSNQETELFEFLNGICDKIIRNDRSLISPYEIDFVIPEKNVAIEYCGLYWHSELAGRNRNYHIDKLDKCQSKGYRLITIFEDEFVNRKEIVFSRLKTILGLNSNKIFARDCLVKEISTNEASEFCNKHHLQGYHGSSIKIGAFYKNKLVSVMTFSKPSIAKGSKYKEDFIWELSRFCSIQDYIIIGIASKLLKFFERNYKWNEIFSYADRRWSDGNLYIKMGFEYSSITTPNYWYLSKQSRIHRFALRKTKEDPKDQTEWQIRKYDGWNRIWDCGNLKYKKINASYLSNYVA